MKKVLLALSLSLCLNLTADVISSWSSPASISTAGVNATFPEMGMDSSGNVVAIWLENGALCANTQDSSGTWGTATTLVASGATNPGIAVDTSGNATAIWVQSGAIKVAAKPFGSAWGSATTLASSGSSSPQIATCSSGNVAAVWLTSDSVKGAYRIGTTWSGASTLSLLQSSVANPQIAIGANGTICAIWNALNTTTSLTFVSSATINVGGVLPTWSTSTVSNTSVNGAYPQVAVDPNGNAIANWFNYNLNSSGVYSGVSLQTSTQPVNGSWTTPLTISATYASNRNPSQYISKVIFTTNGTAIMIWTQPIYEPEFTLFSSQSNNLYTWSSPVAADLSLYTTSAQVALDSNGTGYLAYTYYDSFDDLIVINTKEANVGTAETDYWTSGVQLSNVDNNNFPKITAQAVGTTAYAAALWVNYNGTNTNIESSYGTGTIIAPPTSVTVTQSSTSYGPDTVYYNTISWVASTDPNVYEYAILRNGQLLAEISASNLSYIDYNQIQSAVITYSVCAIDSSGSVSGLASANSP